MKAKTKQKKTKMKNKTKTRMKIYSCFHFRFCFCFCCIFILVFVFVFLLFFVFSLTFFLVFIIKFYYGTSRPPYWSQKFVSFLNTIEICSAKERCVNNVLTAKSMFLGVLEQKTFWFDQICSTKKLRQTVLEKWEKITVN